MGKSIGILTSGGDSPGLNAAIRGIGKAAQTIYGMEVIGFRDGFRGLMENRIVRLDEAALSGILTVGGTILGTSRDKPHAMPVGNKTLDMTDAMLATYEKHHLDALVCLGGGGTQKNALRLKNKGMNVLTLPKTIDNDVACTDVSFGFDTALGIATEALDRLHSTAHSHHRIIVVEIMGHRVPPGRQVVRRGRPKERAGEEQAGVESGQNSADRTGFQSRRQHPTPGQ
jgi:6-phosphofructokinase